MKPVKILFNCLFYNLKCIKITWLEYGLDEEGLLLGLIAFLILIGIYFYLIFFISAQKRFLNTNGVGIWYRPLVYREEVLPGM